MQQKSAIDDTERREFIRKATSMLGVTMCGATITALLAGCEDDVAKPSSGIPMEFDVGSEPALAAAGGAALKTFGTQNGGNPVIIIRTGDSTFKVFTAVCTHQACFVEPVLQNNRIHCDCHQSQFSPDNGENLAGPAQLPLRQFPTVFNEATNTLTITF